MQQRRHKWPGAARALVALWLPFLLHLRLRLRQNPEQPAASTHTCSAPTAAAVLPFLCQALYPVLQNAEKLAASKKTPLVARYVHGKIAYVRAEQ